MRATFAGLLGVLACVTTADLHAQNTLTFFASVVDDKGAPVTALTADDLKVVENGVEGKIAKIAPDSGAARFIEALNEAAARIDKEKGKTMVGDTVAKDTGGRYDNIAASTRIATLLPEIGAQIAKSHTRQSRQFRITFQRPNAAAGPLGQVGAATRTGLTPSLTINGRLP